MKRDRTKENRSGWIFVNPTFCRFPCIASRADHSDPEREGEQMADKRDKDASRIIVSLTRQI